MYLVHYYSLKVKEGQDRVKNTSLRYAKLHLELIGNFIVYLCILKYVGEIVVQKFDEMFVKMRGYEYVEGGIFNRIKSRSMTFSEPRLCV